MNIITVMGEASRNPELAKRKQLMNAKKVVKREITIMDEDEINRNKSLP
jgi:hypothetical protein